MRVLGLVSLICLLTSPMSSAQSDDILADSFDIKQMAYPFIAPKNAPDTLESSPDAVWYFKLGYQEVENRRWDAAIENLTEALTYDSSGSCGTGVLGNAHSELGYAYLSVGDHANALKYLNMGIDLHPRNPSPRLNKSLLLGIQNRTDESILVLDSLIAEINTYAVAYAQRGSYLDEQGKHEQAISDYQMYLYLVQKQGQRSAGGEFADWIEKRLGELSQDSDPIALTFQEFSELTTYFYRNPEPDKLLSAIDYLTSSGMQEDEYSRMAMVHFFAYALKEYPSLVRELFEQQTASGSAQSKIFVVKIFWIMNDSTGNAYLSKARNAWMDKSLQQAIATYQDRGAFDVLSKQPFQGGDLDNLWAVFTATGRPEPVRLIIGAVPHKRQGVVEGNRLMTRFGAAAAYSLTTQAKQHEKVYQYIQEALPEYSGADRQALEEILRKAAEDN